MPVPDEARTYAARGWPVLPLHALNDHGVCTCGDRECISPAKHPRTPNGFKDATTDLAQLEAWWERWPNANVGIRTGSESGLLVLDVDTDGLDALVDLERAHSNLPETPVSITGSGGMHVLFAHEPGLGNARGRLPDGIDVRGDGGYIVAPPSRHACGRVYAWDSDPDELDLAELPAWLSDLIRSNGANGGARAPLPELVPHGQRHVAVVRVAGALRRQGLTPAAILAQLQTFNASCVPPLPEAELRTIAGSTAAWEASDPAWVALRHEPSTAPPDRDALEHLERHVRSFLYLPDPTHWRFALAVAATAELEGNALWGMLVGAPSSGKSESIRALDGIADATVDELTVAGLIGWTGSPTKGKESGLLVRLKTKGPRTFASISDFSSLLAGSKAGTRDDLFALLRRVYDGHVVRSIGTTPQPIEWRGRLTLLAAVTPAIDNYTSHADALGPRWLYCRLPELRGDARRMASQMAREHGAHLAMYRDRTQQLAGRVVEGARARAAGIELGHEATAAIDAVAAVACLGRATIERALTGRREVQSIPIIEETPRIVGQLSLLVRGALAIGLSEPEALALARRAALDTMPQPRRRTLTVLAQGEPVTTAQLARRAAMHWNVARMATEDMEAIGVCERIGDPPDDARAPDPRPWRLAGPDGLLIAEVFNREG